MDQVKNVLRDTLKKALAQHDYDFIVSTLKLYTKNINAMEEKFLLLHTQVYGGARNPDKQIDYLLEADQIITKCLSSVLDENKIASNVILKQYIFYSEKINKFRDTIKHRFPVLAERRIDNQSEMFVGNFLITISSVNRQISTKLGFIALDIVHESINNPDINQESINRTLDLVLSRIETIESIQRVTIKKAYLYNILPETILIVAIISTFIVYIHLYHDEITSNYQSIIAVAFILISILGLSATLILTLLKKDDIIFKKFKL